MQFKKLVSEKKYRSDIHFWESEYKVLWIKMFKYELFNKSTKWTLFKKNINTCDYFIQITELKPLDWTKEERKLLFK